MVMIRRWKGGGTRNVVIQCVFNSVCEPMAISFQLTPLASDSPDRTLKCCWQGICGEGYADLFLAPVGPTAKRRIKKYD